MRHTTIAIFDKTTNDKIKAFVKDYYCKVPLCVENRLAVDTLPYHFTLTQTNINLPNEFHVERVALRKSDKGGWNLHLPTKIDKVPYYITLAVFDCHQQAKQEFVKCIKKFKPFTGKIVSIDTYQIYPAKLIRSET